MMTTMRQHITSTTMKNTQIGSTGGADGDDVVMTLPIEQNTSVLQQVM